MKVNVSPDNPMHRHYNRYQIPDVPWLTSIDMGLWYLLVRQHNNIDAANKMSQKVALVDDPSSISGYALSKIGTLRADWVLQTKEVYFAVMVFLLQKHNNPFYYEFVHTSQSANGNEVDFLLPGKDHVWSTGLRQSQMQSSGLGFNIYGKILKKAYDQWISGAFDLQISVYQLQTELVRVPITYRKTVLILSDSLSRNVKSVQGGTVIAKGGATYDMLADEIVNRNIELQDFRMVMIVCGTNVGRRGRNFWEKSWKPMEDLLIKIPEHSDTWVLVNSPILHPDIKNVVDHTNWLEERFNRVFPSFKFLFFNWAAQAGNPFLDSNGHTLKYLFNGIHLTLAGYRCFWAAWCRRMPELQSVSFHMTINIYPNNPASTTKDRRRVIVRENPRVRGRRRTVSGV